MAGKYEPLADYLKRQRVGEATMSFASLAAIVGQLPPSAYAHEEWWSNSPSQHTQARNGWLAAGWEVASFDIPSEVVTFRKQLS